MITANQEYTIASAENENFLLTIDDDITSFVEFIHVPVVTGYSSTKWKLVGKNKIQLHTADDVYIAVADDEGGGGAFLTDVEANDNITSTTEWTYEITQVGSSGSYKIKAGDGVLTSNGRMNQVTVDTDVGKESQQWFFRPVGRYESHGEFFQQDNLDADGEGVGCVYPRFGLKLQYQWDSFWNRIASLNKYDKSADYKVFFLESHGKACNDVRLNNLKALKREMRDPQLGLEGLLHAQHVQAGWASELAAGIGLPQLSYCSPFTRTLATNTITFGNLPDVSSLTTTIVENCRDQVTRNASEHRHRKEYIEEMLPSIWNKGMPSPRIDFEANFAEYDPYWVHESGSDEDSKDKPAQNNPESDDSFRTRIEGTLDEIFEHEDKTFVHITTHAKWIQEFCRILGRPPYYTVNAVVLPIVVRSNRYA